MAEDREIRVDEIKRLQRERRQKARRRNILIGIVSLTISVVTLLLVIGLLLGGKAPPRYAFLEDGRFEDTSSHPAIVRQRGMEITAPATGLFVPTVKPGERLPRGGSIGLMVPENQRQLLEETLAKREALARAMLHDTTTADSRIKAYRTQTRARIDAVLGTLRRDVSAGNMLAINRLTTDLDQMLSPSILDTPPGATNLPEAKDALTVYENSLRALEHVSALVTIPDTGLITFEKMPALLKGERAEESVETPVLDPTFFESRQVMHLELGDVHQVGDTVATLLTPANPELVVFLPGKRRADFPAEDATLVVRKDQGDPFLTIGISAFQSVEGGLIVSGMLPSAMAEWRLVPQFDLEVRWQQTTGLMLPLRSLMDYDPTDQIAMLLKVSSGQIQSVPVFVRGTDGEHALIEGRVGDPLAPKRFDLYVVNPSEELEGKYID